MCEQLDGAKDISLPGHLSRFMRSGRPTTVSIWLLFVEKNKKNNKHPRIIKEKTGDKQKNKNKKSTPTSFEAVFFLVAAKGLNNDRYNGKNVGWLVKRRAYIKRPPDSLPTCVIGVVHDIRNRA